jgi:hypothetical protein
MEDRSSRPHSCPHATAQAKIGEVLAARLKHRGGPVELAERCKVPARKVSRIIARAGLPRLWELDPISGERIRAGRATDHRYERDTAGELLHIDVKKLGKIPGRRLARPRPQRGRERPWSRLRLRPRSRG